MLTTCRARPADRSARDRGPRCRPPARGRPRPSGRPARAGSTSRGGHLGERPPEDLVGRSGGDAGEHVVRPADVRAEDRGSRIRPARARAACRAGRPSRPSRRFASRAVAVRLSLAGEEQLAFGIGLLARGDVDRDTDPLRVDVGDRRQRATDRLQPPDLPVGADDPVLEPQLAPGRSRRPRSHVPRGRGRRGGRTRSRRRASRRTTPPRVRRATRAPGSRTPRRWPAATARRRCPPTSSASRAAASRARRSRSVASRATAAASTFATVRRNWRSSGPNEPGIRRRCEQHAERAFGTPDDDRGRAPDARWPSARARTRHAVSSRQSATITWWPPARTSRANASSASGRRVAVAGAPSVATACVSNSGVEPFPVHAQHEHHRCVRRFDHALRSLTQHARDVEPFERPAAEIGRRGLLPLATLELGAGFGLRRDVDARAEVAREATGVVVAGNAPVEHPPVIGRRDAGVGTRSRTAPRTAAAAAVRGATRVPVLGVHAVEPAVSRTPLRATSR